MRFGIILSSATLLIAVYPAISKADLIITEIMQNPSAVNDNVGEWFEVFNSGPTTFDLEGFQISDNSSSFTVVGSLVATPGDYLVFGRNADAASNGGLTLDYQYSAFNLNNDDDQLSIEDGTGTLIDSVAYNNSFPFASGVSMELDVTFPTVANNDLASNWAEATTPYGDGDLGTPGTGSYAFVPEPSSLVFLFFSGAGICFRRSRG